MRENIKNTFERLSKLHKTGKRLLVFAYNTDKKVTTLYYLTAIIGSILPVIIMYLYQFLLDSLIQIEAGSIYTIPFAVIALLALRYFLSLLENVLVWAYNRGYFDYLLRYKLQNKINLEFSKKVINLDIPHIENPRIQDQIAKTRDSAMWRMTDFLRSLMYFSERITSVVSSLVVLIAFGWWLPILLTIVSLPRLYLRAKHGTLQWSVYSSGTQETKKLWYLNWIVSQAEVIRESKIFRSQGKLIARYNELQERLLKKQRVTIENVARILTYPAVFEGLVLFGIALFFLPQLQSGLLTVGGFTFLISIVERFSSNIGGITSGIGELFENQYYIENYFEIMDLKPIIPISKNPVDLGEIKPPHIEFRNVSFTYPNEKQSAVKNISFSIEPGESIAFVGPNGAGKSTIIKLLCRFYDPDSGCILINDIDIKEIDPNQWYSFISTLFQEFVHYHFSVAENITLSDPENVQTSKMIEAAKKSGASDFIEHFDHNYNQILGKEYADGTEISTGQWQKLAIARAFYEEAPVLILDEPTSAVDATAEYEIFQNLHSTYGDKSLIFVSHRFSTVRNADRIFVVEEGRITESGTHEELLNLQGTYARMFTLQAKGYQ